MEFRAKVPPIYRKVAQLVANAFYTGPCPPRGAEPGPAPKGRAKPEYVGLGVILLEALTVREWVKEDELAEELKVHPKVVRSALRYLEQQQLVTREHRKETKRRRRSNAAEEAPDAGLGDLVEDAAGLPKAFLHSYCCLDYARLIEVAQLRLALLRRNLKEQVQDKNPVQEYMCPGCAATYNTLQAMDLIDPRDGDFHCQICASVLAPLLDGQGTTGDDAARRERKKRMRELQVKAEEELKPLISKLEEVRRAAQGQIPVPEFGTLTEWALRKADAMAAQKAGKPGSGASKESRIGTYVGAEEHVQIEIDLSGVGDSSKQPAVEAAAPKELPPWLRGEAALANSDGAVPSNTGTGTGVGSGLPGSMSIGTARSDDVSDTAAVPTQADTLVAYRAAWHKRLQESKTKDPGLPPLAPSPNVSTAKRMKTENGRSSVTVPVPIKAEEGQDEEEEDMWEDVVPPSAKAPAPAPAPPAAEADDDEEWEDV
eukprot:jgi/Botrbrau1/15789/Bobra.4_1s0140.1